MNIRVLNKISVALCAAFMSQGALIAEERPVKPNIVVFLVDDLGWADLSSYGSKFHETPNIDQLAASGVRFTHGYASSPVCSPSRISILTGRNTVTHGTTDWIPGFSPVMFEGSHMLPPTNVNYMGLEQITIAEVLKEHDYQTFFLGKWHVSDWSKEGNISPTEQGFDVNIGGWSLGAPKNGYYSPWGNPVLEDPEERTYLTTHLTEKSASLIRQRDKDKPFLLYFSYYNVHGPIQAYEKKIDHFTDKLKKMPKRQIAYIEEEEFGAYTRATQNNPRYASMISAVDESVGEIMNVLKEQGIEKNTLIIFTSDNGGVSTHTERGAVTSNLPLRGGKGWLLEGGIRVPMIVSGPGVQTGKVSDAKVTGMDIFPTILDAANLPLRPDVHSDGKSMLPVLKGKEERIHDTVYWYYPHYGITGWKPGSAIIDTIAGDYYKLIDFTHYGVLHLYNLTDDPGEQNNLATTHPEITQQLHEKLKQWLKTSNAKPLRELTSEEKEAHLIKREKWLERQKAREEEQKSKSK